MFHLYFITKEIDCEKVDWIPVTKAENVLYDFKDSQDAAEFALTITLATEFKIVSDTHERTMKGVRFGSEVLWRINGSKKPIQYRGDVDRFIS